MVQVKQVKLQLYGMEEQKSFVKLLEVQAVIITRIRIRLLAVAKVVEVKAVNGNKSY